MLELSYNTLDFGYFWVIANFLLFLTAVTVALYINFNFNTVMVGLIYLIPLIPLGFAPENAVRFLVVSVQNTVFGLVELVIFVITVKSSDLTFDKKHIQQLLGHTLPIAMALMGLSFISRATTVPVTVLEITVIAVLFLLGTVFRILAVWQLGGVGFKFDIAFRDQQVLKTNQLYGFMRHPSYTAMMVVILSYAINTHHWLAGSIGLVLAWFGFQYRIYHEEKALDKQFGEDYPRYRARTSMWLGFSGPKH